MLPEYTGIVDKGGEAVYKCGPHFQIISLYE